MRSRGESGRVGHFPSEIQTTDKAVDFAECGGAGAEFESELEIGFVASEDGVAAATGFGGREKKDAGRHSGQERLKGSSDEGYYGRVELVVSPPILPMLAKRIEELPAGENWIYEPKWDGFRAIVFRDGDEVLMQSRDEKPLNRYFPELLEPLRRGLPARYVADGEIVIAKNGALDFDELQLRLHPAASRVKLLAAQSPAAVVFFDLLCEGARDLRNEPFRTRRETLQKMLSGVRAPIHLTPATTDRRRSGGLV